MDNQDQVQSRLKAEGDVYEREVWLSVYRFFMLAVFSPY